MNDKIIIDSLDAEEFYRMLLEEVDMILRQPFLSVRDKVDMSILRNIAKDFRDLCGGPLATEDWDKEDFHDDK